MLLTQKWHRKYRSCQSSCKVDLRAGRAADILSAIDPQSIEPFDFIFIDADKQGYPEYLELSLKFSRSGTIIVLDNVIRAGDILNPENKTEY